VYVNPICLFCSFQGLFCMSHGLFVCVHIVLLYACEVLWKSDFVYVNNIGIFGMIKAYVSFVCCKDSFCMFILLFCMPLYKAQHQRKLVLWETQAAFSTSTT